MTRHETFPQVEAVKVRIAVPADVDGCMKLALMACSENALVKPDPVKLLQHIWAALNLDHGICGVIGPVGGELEGIVLLRIGDVWYSADDGSATLIEEKAIYVHEDYRSAKGGRAARLLEFSKWVSDELNLPLSIGILTSDRSKGKTRLYTRYLGEPSGAYWLYNGRTGEVAGE